MHPAFAACFGINVTFLLILGLVWRFTFTFCPLTVSNSWQSAMQSHKTGQMLIRRKKIESNLSNSKQPSAVKCK